MLICIPSNLRLFEVVEANVCVNMRARFVSGASNGGMMTYYLASAFPTTFAAVAPIYALPLKGRMDIPMALKNVSLLQIHDRWDTTIPVQGGKSGQVPLC